MWIGLDIGTTAVKAAAYRADGTMVAMEEAAATVSRTDKGGSEQGMAAVWQCVAEVLTRLTSAVDPSGIEALGLAAQGDGLWMIDDDGQPVESAMLWNDTRAAADILHLSESGASAKVAHGCNTSLWPGTSGTLWRWLRQNQPASAKKAAKAFTCADWVGFKLTGEIATDFSNASIPFLDFASRSYGQSQFDALECGDLQALLPAPQRANQRLGVISEEAARATGLPMGLSVSTGTLDLGAMIVGMGMDRPGQAMLIIGTTAVVNILVDDFTSADEPIGASVLHSTSDAIIRVLAPTTGAAAFDWFASLHPMSLGGESAAEIAAKINALVEEVPPGSNGVTFLPYLNGERAPFVAPDATAAFLGMRGTTTKADLGRAVMEGTGFSLRHCIEEEGGLPEGAVQLTGGGSKNAVWCQIIADIIGHPVIVGAASDQGLWGAACLGAAAAGFGDAITLSRRAESFQTYQPDPERTAIYDRLFERYTVQSDASRAMNAALRKTGEIQ